MDEVASALEKGNSIARPPQQGRSRQSFERMMNAAEALLVEYGNDDFTLTDVSRVGRVSIGSIYNRFSSKDELIQAVHARVMDRIEKDQSIIVMRARSRSGTSLQMVRAVLEELADFLAMHAAVMRPMMLRASGDEVVQRRGAIAHDEMVAALRHELLTLKDKIMHPDPARAIEAVIQVAYASFARELGFGMAEKPLSSTDWNRLKADVGEMAARYLFCRLDGDEPA